MAGPFVRPNRARAVPNQSTLCVNVSKFGPANVIKQPNTQVLESFCPDAWKSASSPKIQAAACQL
jgi:hypothetical protein